MLFVVWVTGRGNVPAGKVNTMKCMLLLYSEPTAGPQTDEEMAAEMPLWFAYTEALETAGVLLGGEALQPTETATTVQVRDGATAHTDGPFAETKEILGGFYMLEVDNLDAALEWGAKAPCAPYGSVEVRPIMEFG